jgi:hypothetical protein
MKTKATTLSERFGFQDKELVTPKHDDIFCWLFNKSNIVKMIVSLGLLQDAYYSATRLETCVYHNSNCDWSWDTHTCTGNCNKHLINKNTNQPVDLAKETNNNFLNFHKNISEAPIFWPDLITIDGEFPIVNGTYNIGFVDAKITFDTKISQEDNGFCYFSKIVFKKELLFYIEIKPSVQSLGELIRQINLYRSHTGEDGIWIILTDKIPDAFIPILHSQSIYVYVRPKETSLCEVNK